MLNDYEILELELESSLFWETDITQLNFQENSTYIIGRVLMYGNLNDWLAIKKYYGVEKIKQTAINLQNLDKLTLNFCSMYFETPKEQFRCSNTQQLV